MTIIPKHNVLSDKDLIRLLRTRDELTFIVNCSGDKYKFVSLGLKVFEGGEYLLRIEENCSLVSRLIKCFGDTFLPTNLVGDIVKIC